VFYSFASKPSNRNDQSSKAQATFRELQLLGTSEPDQQQALLETATADRASTLPVSLCRKRYEKKIFNAEACNEETPTLQT
jgi:hypothetical protein